MPSLAAKILLLCFMWLLHSAEPCEHHNRLSKYFKGCSSLLSVPLHTKCSMGGEENRRMPRTA